MTRYTIVDHPFVSGLECDLSKKRWRAIKPIATNVLREPFGAIERDTAVFKWGNYMKYREMGVSGTFFRDFTVLRSDVSGDPVVIFDELPGPDETVECFVFDPKAGRFRSARLKASDDQFDIERLWFGALVKGGGTAVVVGKEVAVGALANIATKQVFPFLMTTTRAGLGWGASGGVALGLAYGFTQPQQFVGTDTSNMLDFSLALGLRWGSFIKSANPKALKAGIAAVQGGSALLREIQGTVRSTQLLVSATSRFVNSEIGVNLAKSIAGLSVLDTGGPNFTAIDIPVGGVGAELAVFTAMGSIKAVDGPSIDQYLASVGQNPFANL